MEKSRPQFMIIVTLLAACLLIQSQSAWAFTLNDLTSTAETAQSAAEGASLLDRAKNVYDGFYDSTENLVDAQTTTMSLINPQEGSALLSQLGDINSGSTMTRLTKLVGLSQSMDAQTTSPSLTSKLTEIITTPGSIEKAQKIYGHATNAYSSGTSSVGEAKTLYKEIKDFIASPSAKGLSETLLSGLGNYSDKILPYIIENGPERLKAAAQIAEAFKGFL